MHTESTPQMNYAGLLTRIGIATIVLLCVPLLGNLLSNEVNWSPLDFVVMGSLVFLCGSVATVGFKLLRPSLRLPFVMMISLTFVYLWVELAVGVFFNLGS